MTLKRIPVPDDHSRVRRNFLLRFGIAGLLLAVMLPAAEAKSPKSQCKDRCGGQYQFCLRRATTKQARNGCKTVRKTCKKQCGG
jgi:hypothetical protein